MDYEDFDIDFEDEYVDEMEAAASSLMFNERREGNAYIPVYP